MPEDAPAFSTFWGDDQNFGLVSAVGPEKENSKRPSSVWNRFSWDMRQQAPPILSEPVTVTEHTPHILRSWNHTHLEWTTPVWPALCDRYDCMGSEECKLLKTHTYHWDSVNWNVSERLMVPDLDPEK